MAEKGSLFDFLDEETLKAAAAEVAAEAAAARRVQIAPSVKMAPEIEMADDGPSEQKIWQVGELSARVRGTLESIGRVVVEGEISGAKLAASGHFYADLKDAMGVLNLVAWRGTVQRWGGVPESGAQVVITGRLTTHPARSSYQLVAEKIEMAGLGALMQQLEALKQQLAAEGLFDLDRKRELPLLPQRIGIVTSSKGSVIRDMLHRLAERCPRPVTVWPVAVQGLSAAAEIAAAVAGFNRLPMAKRPHVLIVARGGGSFEDLMAFNDEQVVRAIAASGIPVISGVGHEPDVTLCDLVADVRAPTPTAAAEYVVPVAADLLYTAVQQGLRLRQALRQQVAAQRAKVDYLHRLLPDPRRQVVQVAERLEDLQVRMLRSGRLTVLAQAEKLLGLERVLLGLNPKAPLQKGYAYITRAGDTAQVVRRASEATGRLNLHFADGEKLVEVIA